MRRTHRGCGRSAPTAGCRAGGRPRRPGHAGRGGREVRVGRGVGGEWVQHAAVLGRTDRYERDRSTDRTDRYYLLMPVPKGTTIDPSRTRAAIIRAATPVLYERGLDGIG